MGNLASAVQEYLAFSGNFAFRCSKNKKILPLLFESAIWNYSIELFFRVAQPGQRDWFGIEQVESNPSAPTRKLGFGTNL